MIGRDFSIYGLRLTTTVTFDCLVGRERGLMLEWTSQVESLGHGKEWRLMVLKRSGLSERQPLCILLSPATSSAFQHTTRTKPRSIIPKGMKRRTSTSWQAGSPLPLDQVHPDESGGVLAGRCRMDDGRPHYQTRRPRSRYQMRSRIGMNGYGTTSAISLRWYSVIHYSPLDVKGCQYQVATVSSVQGILTGSSFDPNKRLSGTPRPDTLRQGNTQASPTQLVRPLQSFHPRLIKMRQRACAKLVS